MGAMGNKFRYYLTYQGIRQEIVFAPQSWDTETIGQYKRDLGGYFGLIRSLSLPLSFVKDAYQRLRNAFLNDGIEAGVRLEVDERQNDWSYLNIFYGDLDFSQFKPNGITYEVPLMEAGIGKQVKAKEGIKYEYLLEGDDVVNIVLPGIQFEEKAIFVPNYVDTTSLNSAKRFTIGINLTNSGFKSGFVISQSTLQRNAADTDDFTGDFFVRGNRVSGVLINIKGNLKGYIRHNPIENELSELYLMNTVTKERVYTFVSKDGTGSIESFDVDFDFNYTLPFSQGLCIYSRVNNGGGNVSYVATNEGEINVSYATVSDPSNCKGIKAYDLFKRISQRILPDVPINSVLINSQWKNLIFTCGTAIRELDKPKIKITFKEFFDTFNAITDAAFGLDNGVARLEEGYYFARNTMIMDIGNVNSCEASFCEELAGNLVKIGYNDGNTEDENGLEEYNSGQEYELPLSRVQKEIPWISPTRADQYGIERLRVLFNITKQSTSDTSSDNDTFMIDCYQDGVNYKPILGSTYDSITGLSFPLSAYNLRLTPKQNLLRHSGYLASILDRQNGRTIEFGSGTKNTDLVTIKDGVRVAEGEGVAVSSLDGKYFQPYIFNLKGKIPVNAMRLMDSTPFGYVRFNFNDIVAEGFIIMVSQSLGDNSERELQLLATATSNIPV